MILRVVGVNHFDPTHRPKLAELMTNWAQEGDGNPCFIAVEWDQEQFRQGSGAKRTIPRPFAK